MLMQTKPCSSAEYLEKALQHLAVTPIDPARECRYPIKKGKKRVKLPVKFCAELPTLLSRQKRERKISFKEWRTLKEDCRTKYRKYPGTGWNYYRIDHLAPYSNPAIETIKERLRVKRVAYREEKFIKAFRSNLPEPFTVEFTRIITY